MTMYDYVCTDLPRHTVGYGTLGRLLSEQRIALESWPFRPEGVPSKRVLVISASERTLEEAALQGFGILAQDRDAAVERPRLRPLLSAWTDSAEGCSLFVFDLGNVVIRGIHILGKVAEHDSLPRQEFFDDYRRYDTPLMEGTISTADYWVHVERKFGIKVDGDPFEREFSPVFDDDIVRLARQLRAAGRRVVCGSNTFAPHWEIIDRMGALDLFDATYASHLMGIAKPSPLFYRHILDREGFEPGQAYFLDDNEENIGSASKLGMRCLLYADGIRDASEKLRSAFGR
jgi:putative hydrolase of the HAD superfamily